MPTRFDRDTALDLRGDGELTGTLSADWRAGVGPHGGYVAAIVMRGLQTALDDPGRSPRALTVQYLAVAEPGPITMRCRIERAGRSLATVSGRLLHGTRTIALGLAAFSPSWDAPELGELPMPDAAPPEPERVTDPALAALAPPFVDHMVLQPRLGAPPCSGPDAPMESGGWTGLVEPRVTDAIALALYSDAWLSPPYTRTSRFVGSPTITLTIAYRDSRPRQDPHELCLARFTSTLVHEGFFEEDGVIWAPDGTVLAQSRQFAILQAARWGE
jgi:hypothetical protein